MKKLNKNGWGLRVELVFIFIFVICLIIAIVGLSRMGAIENINKALNSGVTPQQVIPGDENSSSSTEVSSSTISSTESSSEEIIVNDELSKYETLENTLIESSKKYIVDKHNGQIDEYLFVRSSILVNGGYLYNFYDSNGKSCTGYVEAIENVTVKYNAYINCEGYTTFGYDSSKDW